MKRFAKCVWLLVALWLPASSHSLLDTAGFIHDWHDADEDFSGQHQHHTDDHDVADGLCLLSPTDVSLSVAVIGALPLPISLPNAEWTPDFPDQTIHSRLTPPGVTPPEPSHRWQFSSRAALPVRAPSFAS